MAWLSWTNLALKCKMSGVPGNLRHERLSLFWKISSYRQSHHHDRHQHHKHHHHDHQASKKLVRSSSSIKTSPSIFRPVLSRGETVDSCCSQCSDDVRWYQWNASQRPRTRKQENHCLSLFNANLKFPTAVTILFTKKQTCLVKLVYLYINPNHSWLPSRSIIFPKH